MPVRLGRFLGSARRVLVSPVEEPADRGGGFRCNPRSSGGVGDGGRGEIWKTAASRVAARGEKAL